MRSPPHNGSKRYLGFFFPSILLGPFDCVSVTNCIHRVLAILPFFLSLGFLTTAPGTATMPPATSHQLTGVRRSQMGEFVLFS